MALAHPPHPIRSRVKCRNLWVGWCVSPWRPLFCSVYSIHYHVPAIFYSCISSNWYKLFQETFTFQDLAWPGWYVEWYDTFILSYYVSNVYFNCMVRDSLCHNLDISAMWHCTLVSCTSSQTGSWVCAVLVLRAPLRLSISVNLVLWMRTSLHVSATGHSLWILGRKTPRQYFYTRPTLIRR